tara:strand:- start:40 stop:849 length:810 start_codon:yes stop_codon:yes gene_type:complete
MMERRLTEDRRNPELEGSANALAAAMENGAIRLHYQPQFSLDGTIVGAEALARWQGSPQGAANDAGQNMAGEALFALAEANGQVQALGDHLRIMAFTAAARWPDDLKLSFNATAQDLAREDFVASLTGLLEETQCDPARLTLEITEQEVMRDLDNPAARLKRIRALGIGVALDDFGAGFCNFGYLKKLPVNCLKLDRSMIAGVGEDTRDLEILRAIIAMARALNLAVVAEGIESEDQRDLVIAEGCTAWQGFFGAGALSEDELLALVAR